MKTETKAETQTEAHTPGEDRRTEAIDDLSRPILIHCCKDGTITYRTRRQKVFNGLALPMFSVDTEAQAEKLQAHFCRLQYGEHPNQPGKPWYRLTNFGGTLEDLERVRVMFREVWTKL